MHLKLTLASTVSGWESDVRPPIVTDFVGSIEADLAGESTGFDSVGESTGAGFVEELADLLANYEPGLAKVL